MGFIYLFYPDETRNILNTIRHLIKEEAGEE